MNWKILPSNPALTSPLIRKYKGKKFYLGWASANPSLTFSLMEDNKDKLDWDKLSTNPALSPLFIEVHKKKLDWMSPPKICPACFFSIFRKNNWTECRHCFRSRGPSSEILRRGYGAELKRFKGNPTRDPITRKTSSITRMNNAAVHSATAVLISVTETTYWRAKNFSPGTPFPAPMIQPRESLLKFQWSTNMRRLLV